MTCRLVSVTYDAQDPAAVAAYWSGLLGREPTPDAGGVLLAGDETQVGLRFVATGSASAGADYLHLHLTSDGAEAQQRTVDQALGLGGRRVDVGQTPEEGHIVVGDPEGNLFCVIEPHNSYLAGTGFLGEVACDGRREVGLFWRDALGWELVWDENDETAIQSPLGGTKVAWGGARHEPKQTRNRQRFDLAASDAGAETERLVGLGAARLGDRDGVVELADPDGNEFTLAGGRASTARQRD